MKLAVAVLMPEMVLPAEDVAALLALRNAADARGWSIELRLTRRSRADETRNEAASALLAGDADALLLLSADLLVEADMVARMVASGREVVGCLYPARPAPWTRLLWDGEAIERRRPAAPAFVGELAPHDGALSIRDGFARALHVGGGCILVRRGALERMREAYPELEGAGFRKGPETRHANWGFFNRLDQPHGAPLRGDFAFCRRWRACGGELWADIVSSVGHVGRGQWVPPNAVARGRAPTTRSLR